MAITTAAALFWPVRGSSSARRAWWSESWRFDFRWFSVGALWRPDKPTGGSTRPAVGGMQLRNQGFHTSTLSQTHHTDMTGKNTARPFSVLLPAAKSSSTPRSAAVTIRKCVHSLSINRHISSFVVAALGNELFLSVHKIFLIDTTKGYANFGRTWPDARHQFTRDWMRNIYNFNGSNFTKN
jgi:hypothetical protein